MLRTLAIALLFASAGAPAQQPGATPSAVELLLRNARYWQARGREEKAVEAMEKVLRSEPKEPASGCRGGHRWVERRGSVPCRGISRPACTPVPDGCAKMRSVPEERKEHP